MFKKILNLAVILCFFMTTLGPAYSAEEELNLPVPGTMVNLSHAYEPVLIRGLKINPDNPLSLDFIVSTGNSNFTAQDQDLKTESEKLIKYFFAALTLPEKDVWVNLSPYEKNRIVPDATGQTEMGRDMLAQDYVLKQITASLIYPERGLGKNFWDRIYDESFQRFGTTQIPVNTFNKVWIVADKASVYEAKNTVLVVDAHLKVMLEEDYMALEKHSPVSKGSISSATRDTHTLGSQIVREVVLPALEKEVNEGKNFAPLRQIFHSIILAKWYKETLKTALLNQVYSNKNKISGVDVEDKTIKDQIYQQYLKAYKKGVFNYIKEDIDQTTKQPMPRKYFSGGVSTAMVVIPASPAMASESIEEEPGKEMDVREVSVESDTSYIKRMFAGLQKRDADFTDHLMNRAKQRGMSSTDAAMIIYPKQPREKNFGEMGVFGVRFFNKPDALLFSRLNAGSVSEKRFRIQIEMSQNGRVLDPQALVLENGQSGTLWVDPQLKISSKKEWNAIRLIITNDAGRMKVNFETTTKQGVYIQDNAILAVNKVVKPVSPWLDKHVRRVGSILSPIGRIVARALEPADDAGRNAKEAKPIENIRVKMEELLKEVRGLQNASVKNVDVDGKEVKVFVKSNFLRSKELLPTAELIEALKHKFPIGFKISVDPNTSLGFQVNLTAETSPAMISVNPAVMSIVNRFPLSLKLLAKSAAIALATGLVGCTTVQNTGTGHQGMDSSGYVAYRSNEQIEAEEFYLSTKKISLPVPNGIARDEFVRDELQIKKPDDVVVQKALVDAIEGWKKAKAKDLPASLDVKQMASFLTLTLITPIPGAYQAYYAVGLKPRVSAVLVESKAMMVNKTAAALLRPSQTPGGINLDSSKFTIHKTGSGIEIKFNPAVIAQFKQGNFKGIMPIITSITPITDIYLMVGLRKPQEDEKLASLS